MERAGAFIRLVDTTNEFVGRAVSWLTLFMVLAQMTVVLMRYVFGVGWLALQEAAVYMHAAVFLLAAGYTLVHDGHVRIDFLYRPASQRAKARINLLGSIFLLLPMATAIFWTGWPYVAKSWAVLEGSPEGSGIPAVFLLKSLILAYAALLALQGIALGLRSALFLSGAAPPAPPAARDDAEPL